MIRKQVETCRVNQLVKDDQKVTVERSRVGHWLDENTFT